MKATFVDPRYFQILTLSILLSLQVFWADFGADVKMVLSTVFSALLVQFMCCKFVKTKFDYKSPLITALSLTILLKSASFLIYPVAALVAICSKFIFRVEESHLFNPANIGIVIVLLLFPGLTWVSPGQWGSSVWLILLLACLAFVVLHKIASRDIVFYFLASWCSLVFARAFWLGDDIAIPFHQLQSGALLVFAFFMISDPKTIPYDKSGRVIFSLAVSIIAYILQYEFYIREAIFYSLAIVCFTRWIYMAILAKAGASLINGVNNG